MDRKQYLKTRRAEFVRMLNRYLDKVRDIREEIKTIDILSSIDEVDKWRKIKKCTTQKTEKK